MVAQIDEMIEVLVLAAYEERTVDRHWYGESHGAEELRATVELCVRIYIVTVKLNGRPMRLLNELEWIDGKIWANVYTTDLILIIDPATGNVIGKMDCSSLIPQDKRTPSMDVLNGIAVRHTDKGEDEIFLTGKNWPWMFRVSVSER